MNLLGAILTLSAGFFYSLRYSFMKDLGKHKVSNASVNLFYRLVSLPLVLLILIVSGEHPLEISREFLIWFSVALLVNVLFGLYQVYSFQKHAFSHVESLSFLDIVITSLAGLLLFGEVLSIKQLVGLSAIILAFLIITYHNARKKMQWPMIEVILYYAFVSLVNVVNKQAVRYTSPLLYVLYLTVGLIAANYVLTLGDKTSLYRWNIKEANKLLFFVGLFGTLSFIGVSYGYKLLPVGIVSALISLKVFISLWLSHKKYEEQNLRPQIYASIVAVAGTMILFL